MTYIGLQSQKRRNNLRSTILLILFPVLLVGLTWLLFFLLFTFSGTDFAGDSYSETGYSSTSLDVLETTNESFLYVVPWVLGGCLVWFLIAYFSNTAMIRSATSSHSLSRTENKRVYNLVENLCMTVGMPMPKLNVIEDDSLNAFASGIDKKTYTVTLSRGIINKLDDEELKSVIAHELTHIRNNDVRLLIVSIVFVGIFAFISEMMFRMLIHSPRKSSNNNNKGGAIALIVVALVVAAVGYLLATLMRFAISRKREYMADAGAAEMTKNPLALASALRKISKDPYIEAVKRDDVAQMFIEHTGKKKKKGISFSSLFATHPPIGERIRVLEQF